MTRRGAAIWVVLATVPGAVVPVGAQQSGAQETVHAGMAMGDEAQMSPQGRPELPSTSDFVRVEVDRAAHVAELIVGPVSLPAGGPHVRLPIQLVDLPFAGWIHAYTWNVQDAQGNELPPRLLHHVHLIDPDSRELFAPTPRRFIAAGRETADVRLPSILGYPVAPNTRALVTSMFAPRPDASFDEVYLHLRLEYTPADDHGLIAPRSLYPVYLDVMGPVGAKYFDLPPGMHQHSWEGSPAMGGRLLGLTAHLHDYADWIRLEDVTRGKVVWQATPERDSAGRVLGVPMTRLWWRGGIPIYADHTYRLTVQYTNPLDVPAPDAAMGVIGGVMVGDPDAWPEFDPNDPAYIADLRNTLESPEQMMDMHEHGGMDEPEGTHDHGGVAGHEEMSGQGTEGPEGR